MEDLDRLVCISEQVKKKTLEAKREEITRATKMYRKLIYLEGSTHILFTRYRSCPLTNLFGQVCHDLELFIFSALHVRSKVAMVCLRSSLEQAVFGLYYSEDSQ